MPDCDGRSNYAKFSKTLKYGYERNIKTDKWYNIYINASFGIFFAEKKTTIKQTGFGKAILNLLQCTSAELGHAAGLQKHFL